MTVSAPFPSSTVQPGGAKNTAYPEIAELLVPNDSVKTLVKSSPQRAPSLLASTNSTSSPVTPQSVDKKKKEVFKELLKTIPVTFDKSLSLQQQNIILDNLQSPIVQRYLSKLAESSADYKKATGTPLTLVIGAAGNDGNFMENDLIAASKKGNPDEMRLGISKKLIDAYIAEVKDGKIDDPYEGQIFMSTTFRNEISELDLRLTSIADLSQKNSQVKDKPRHEDNVYVGNNLVSSTQIQLTSIAIDQTQWNDYYEWVTLPRISMSIDPRQRDLDMRKDAETSSPQGIVSSLNHLAGYYQKGYALTDQVSVDSSQQNRKKPLWQYQQSDVFERLEKFRTTDLTDEDYKYSRLPKTESYYPQNAVEIRDKFVQQRLEEAFPEQAQFIGFRFEKSKVQVIDKNTNKLIWLSFGKPVFFLKPQ